MWIQLPDENRSMRHDGIYLEIGMCIAAVARGTNIDDLPCSTTILFAVAFVVGNRVWTKGWSDEEIWRRLDKWQQLAVFDHGVHPMFKDVAVSPFNG
jgi:hypothetical protein